MSADRSAVIFEAQGLRSEDGENPEYDRALVELAQRILGTGHEGREADHVRTLILGAQS